jgi:hypothetical protein
MNKLADWIISVAKRNPYWHLEGYMERFWIVPFAESGSANSTGCFKAQWYRNPLIWIFQKCDIAARVHHILRSDDDRAFHDHPWPYVSIILKGGYFEITPIYDKSGLYCGKSWKWYGPGSILIRPARSWHRLVIDEGTDTWTLFITGKYQQRWGFLPQPRTKIDYREYLGLEKSPDA